MKKAAIGIVLFEDSSARYLPYLLTSLQSAVAACPQADWKIYFGDNSLNEDNPNRDLVCSFPFLEKEYIFNGGNLGFGGAYNLLIDRAVSEGYDYFFAINPDLILDEKCLAELFTSLESDGSIASAAPKLLRWDFASLSKTDVIDSCGIIMALGLRFFDLGQGEKDSRIFDSAKIIGPSGAFAAYRISALSDIKSGRDYFDSRMFMYKEDCDLDYRLFLAGHRSQFVPKAIAYHDRSVSSVGGRKSRSLAVRRWSWQNQKLIWNKYWRKQSLAGKILVALYFISQYCWLAVFERNVLKNK